VDGQEPTGIGGSGNKGEIPGQVPVTGLRSVFGDQPTKVEERHLCIIADGRPDVARRHPSGAP